MKLIINGKEEEIKESKISLEALLKLKEVKTPEMVSVQINGTIIGKKENDFSKTYVRDNDEVDFLYFMGGGSNFYFS
jgi:sulfur carrier protein